MDAALAALGRPVRPLAKQPSVSALDAGLSISTMAKPTPKCLAWDP
ncbi:MAG: hypothetical protein ACLQFR_21710 [Streptosporangiaceae bacterium]